LYLGTISIRIIDRATQIRYWHM